MVYSFLLPEVERQALREKGTSVVPVHGRDEHTSLQCTGTSAATCWPPTGQSTDVWRMCWVKSNVGRRSNGRTSVASAQQLCAHLWPFTVCT